MKPIFHSRHLYILVGSSLMAISFASAQTTYTWNNSNVDNTTPITLDWFTGGSNTQGAWSPSPGAQGSSLITNADTVQFFANTTTALTNTVSVVQNSVVNNDGTAVQLGTLTFSGKESSTANANFTFNLSGDALNFSAATGTINLDFLRVGRTVSFNVSNNIQLGTSISATALTFTGNSSASFDFTGNITSQQAGTSTVNKSGSSTLILSGINSFNGLTLNGGNLRAGNNSTSSGNDNFGAAGSTISVTGNSTISYGATASYTFDKSIAIASGVTLTFVKSADGSHTYQGVLSGGNDTTVAVNDAGTIGNRTLVFSNTANTFTGAIDLSASNSTISFNSLSDASGAGNIKFGSNANRSSAFQFGSGAVAPLVLTNRKIEIIAGASTAGTASIYNNAAHTLTINSDLVVTGTGGTKTLQLRGSNTGYNTFGGVIANGGLTALSLSKLDAGTWVLSGLNTYTGTTTIGANNSVGGTLVINTLKNYGEASSLGAATSGDIIFNRQSSISLVYVGSGNTSNRTIQHGPDVSNRNNGSGIYNNGTGALIFNGITFNTPYVESGNGGRTTTFNLGGTYTGSANEIRGVIANNDATSLIAIAKVGSGTWTLGGSNTYTGATTLNAGTLKLNYDTGANGTNTSKLANTNGILALNGGTLELAGGSHTEVVTSTTLNNGTTFIKQTGGGSSTLSMGVITYTGGALDFSAAGIANVSTSAVTNGILSSAAGTARVTVGGADWAAKDGSNNVIAYTGYDTTFAGGATSVNVNYSINGSQGVDGVVTLAGNRGAASNTFKITTSGDNQAIALGGNTLTLGSMLFAGANNYSITNTTGGRINSAFLLHNYGAGTLTLGDTNGLITQFGTGTTILSGNNASNVGINIFGGTVRFSNNLQIGTNAGVQAISLNNGTLVADTTSADIALNNGGLNSRTVTLGAGGGTLDVIGGGMLTVSGVISGAGNDLTIGSGSSNGTIELTGTNTYTGRTVISGGILSVGAIGNGGVAGNLGQASSLAYNIVFDGGTLLYTGANATSDRAFTISAGKTATIHTTNNLSLAGATGPATSGALIKTGAGALTLTSTNTYTGATTVSAGTLYVTGALSNSAVIVGANGTIGSNGLTGTLGNGLTILAGGNLDLTGATLEVDGNSTGILSLTGATPVLTLGNLTFQDIVGWDWANAAVGAYELIDGTFTIDFGSTAYLSEETAYDFGNGKKGYFTSGSLTAVIVAIPEPSTALLGGLGALLLMLRRRR